VLRRDEPFTIEAAVTVRQQSPGLTLAVSIESLRGVRMLDESLFDHDPTSLEQPGDHVVRLTIPPVLNSGDYVVNLWLGNDYEDLGWFERALSFHLEGVTAGRADRALRLDLPWDVTRLPGASPVEAG
jgi:ABC-2 type transport system ATP-binding protein/lipopolysaccharide transport system ATP-binding protein